jgi:hypothetical protein
MHHGAYLEVLSKIGQQVCMQKPDAAVYIVRPLLAAPAMLHVACTHAHSHVVHPPPFAAAAGGA